MSQYILAIDQGTTSSRAIVYTAEMDTVASAHEDFPQHYPQDGWVEHDPEDIWQTVLRSGRSALAKANVGDHQLVGIGISNQRETTLVWDRETGEAVTNAIVWQDRRTADICHNLKAQGLESTFQEKTGLLIDPYFSGTKIQWILNNVPGAKDRAEQGRLAFGTVDSFLLWRLTKGKVHATDATNASRTLVFDIHNQQWDEQLLELLGIPKSMLPEVKNSADEFGESDAEWFGSAIPVRSLLGDQHAALVGQACFEPGLLKSTYGTGCFAVVNTGSTPVTSHHRLLTTLAYRLNGKPTYALEGSIFMAGAIVQWLRDGIGLIQSAGDTETLAKSVPHDQAEIMVPAFTGLGAPYWDPNARAAIFGMTRDTGVKELVAAALHSVALQTEDLMRAMRHDGIEIKTLRVDGGMIYNRWFLQTLASITGIPTVTGKTAETTSQGAAMFSALQAGLYSDLNAMSKIWEAKERYRPLMSETEREALYDRWQKAVAKVRTDQANAEL